MTDTTTPASPGSIGWFEIGTDDPSAARQFYGDVFGWTFDTSVPAYTIVTTGKGHPLQGGIRDTRADAPDGTPAAYALPYVLVDDVAATCAAAESAGGKVVVGATTTPDGLVWGLVDDPAGNTVGLFTPPAA
jgi:uncharacterized protein